MSLKELKNRIVSVSSLLKITSAMRMISSAKMHKVQMQHRRSRPYREMLSNTLSSLLKNKTEGDWAKNPLMQIRGGKKKVLIAIASDSSLCGAYNHNVWKTFLDRYEHEGETFSKIYCIGKKLETFLKKRNISYDSFPNFKPADPSKEQIRAWTQLFISQFLKGEVDEVHLLYTKSRNIAHQEVRQTLWLPYQPILLEKRSGTFKEKEPSFLGKGAVLSHFLFEPNEETILNYLLQSQLLMDMEQVFLNAAFSEHASRMMAMQTAEDNAKELLSTLQLQYNKQRQNLITAELLDMAGALM